MWSCHERWKRTVAVSRESHEAHVSCSWSMAELKTRCSSPKVHSAQQSMAEDSQADVVLLAGSLDPATLIPRIQPASSILLAHAGPKVQLSPHVYCACGCSTVLEAASRALRLLFVVAAEKNMTCAGAQGR